MSQWLSLRQVEDVRKQAICHMIKDSMFLDVIQAKKENFLHPLSTTGWNLYFEYPDYEPRSLVYQENWLPFQFRLGYQLTCTGLTCTLHSSLSCCLVHRSLYHWQCRKTLRDDPQ